MQSPAQASFWPASRDPSRHEVASPSRVPVPASVWPGWFQDSGTGPTSRSSRSSLTPGSSSGTFAILTQHAKWRRFLLAIVLLDTERNDTRSGGGPPARDSVRGSPGCRHGGSRGGLFRRQWRRLRDMGPLSGRVLYTRDRVSEIWHGNGIGCATREQKGPSVQDGLPTASLRR